MLAVWDFVKEAEQGRAGRHHADVPARPANRIIEG
jgi:hypothetical protein